MKENTVIAFRNPADFQEGPLTDVLRTGARQLLAQAVEAEVASFLETHAALVDDVGRRRVVRNGYLPERAIQTGIGPVIVPFEPLDEPSGFGGRKGFIKRGRGVGVEVVLHEDDFGSSTFRVEFT